MASIQPSRMQVSAEEVRAALDYEPDTGLFRWRVRTSKSVRVGDVAGSPTSNGYTRLRLNGVEYLAHRIAWLCVNGEHPTKLIDHIDGNKQNNAIANLRLVSMSENVQNQKRAMSHNKTGFLGVSHHGKNVFRAAINIGGKGVYIGSFKTPEAAHAAYLTAKREFHSACTI